MPVDPVMTAITRNIAREHNGLKADLHALERRTPVYQRGKVASIDPATGTAVVTLRGVGTNSLRYLESYSPAVDDDVVVQQVGTDAIIIGALQGIDDGWHDIGAGSEPAFQNSWVNYGSGYRSTRFRLTGKSFEITGVVQGGSLTLPSVIFTLPMGPTEREIFLQDGQDGVVGRTTGRIDVLASGDVSLVAFGGVTSVDYLSLCGIKFAID